MKERVFVIIVTYNASKWVDTCFTSLRKSSLPVEVVVIDNGSTDNTISLIQTNFPEVDLVISNENLGFGKANNIGLKKALDASADYVFLLNQDAWVDFDTIEKLVLAQKTNPEFGVLSPIHLTGNGEQMDANFYDCFTEKNQNKSLRNILSAPSIQAFDIRFVNAALWLISKKCLEEVGGFDSLFYHYGEDKNYIHRVKYHGFKLGVVPAAFGYHDRQTRGARSLKQLLQKEITMFYSNTTDPALNPKEQTDKYIKEKRKRALKKILKGNIIEGVKYLNTTVEMRRKISLVEESIRRNKVKGAHYIS